MPSLRNLVARAVNRGCGPVVPARNRLAFNYLVARVGGCEPELIAIDRLGPNRGVAIDAGANEGLFTYRLARLYERVHAFEINPTLANRLSALAPRNVTVHPIGLSSRSGTATLFTPFFHGRPLTGWASLDPDNCPSSEHILQTEVSVRPLDTLEFDNVTFLKADVEGHELDLLTGARETIRRNRPVVLLEVKAKNVGAVNAFFSGLGYSERALKSLAGIAGTEENHIFVPA